MKKTLILAALLFVAFGAQAQIHFGLSTAVNSTFVLDKGLSEDPRYNSEMTYNFAPVGFTFGANFTNKFGIQLESIYAHQGQLFEVIDVAEKVVGERKIDLSYIHLPLLLKFMDGSNKAARTYFSLGPQLSILTQGIETLQYEQSIMEIPDEYTSANGDGTYTILDVSTNEILTDEATMNEDGTYNVPELPTTEFFSSDAIDDFDKFRNAEFQIAASLGLDIDLSKNLFLSSLIRANYSLTDMRNEDVIKMLQEQGVNSVIDKRANLIIGIQLGLSYMIGGTRSFGR